MAAAVLPAKAVVIFDNTSLTVSGASSTDLSTTYGDRFNLAQTGVLDELVFRIFNSSSGNTGNLDAVNVLINFYNGNSFNTANGTGTLLGSFAPSVTFSSALQPGFVSTITATGLATLPFPVNLNVADIFVTQKVTSFTGASTRFGTAITTGTGTPSVGANFSAGYFRQNSSGTGIVGASNNNNISYSISVAAQPPGPAVPVPLPLLGVAAAFRWSRKYKRAICRSNLSPV